MNWKETKNELPPINELVDTKIDDEKGIRNEGTLRFHDNLWWMSDDKMYVYYTPTHWKTRSTSKE